MRIVIVAGGELAPGDANRLEGADLVIAADGGASALDALGRRPDRLVGDLDSVEPALVLRLEAEGVAGRPIPPGQGRVGHRARARGGHRGRRHRARPARRDRRHAARPRAREPPPRRRSGPRHAGPARRAGRDDRPRRPRRAAPRARRHRGRPRHPPAAGREGARRDDRRPALGAPRRDPDARGVARTEQRHRRAARIGLAGARDAPRRRNHRTGSQLHDLIHLRQRIRLAHGRHPRGGRRLGGVRRRLRRLERALDRRHARCSSPFRRRRPSSTASGCCPACSSGSSSGDPAPRCSPGWCPRSVSALIGSPVGRRRRPVRAAPGRGSGARLRARRVSAMDAPVGGPGGGARRRGRRDPRYGPLVSDPGSGVLGDQRRRDHG